MGIFRHSEGNVPTEETKRRSAWLAQSVDCEIPDLGVMSLRPMLGLEITLRILKAKLKNKNIF